MSLWIAAGLIVAAILLITNPVIGWAWIAGMIWGYAGNCDNSHTRERG